MLAVKTIRKPVAMGILAACFVAIGLAALIMAPGTFVQRVWAQEGGCNDSDNPCPDGQYCCNGSCDPCPCSD